MASRTLLRLSRRNHFMFDVTNLPSYHQNSRDYNYPFASVKVGTMLREAANALDRVGCRFMGNYAYLEYMNRHKRVNHFRGIVPVIGDDVFIAPNATVIGEAKLHRAVALWYNVVVRGDENSVEIGSNTQVLERSIIKGGLRYETKLGANVYVGPSCVLVGCLIADGATLGPGCVVNENCLIGENAQLEAGTILTRDDEVGPGEYWAGAPGKFVRMLRDEEKEYNKRAHESSVDLAVEHKDECNKPYEQIITERDVRVAYKRLETFRSYIWAK